MILPEKDGHSDFSKRTIVLGLDGLGPNLFDLGLCPYLTEMFVKYTSCILKSTKPAISPVAWASLLTGKSPANHGLAGFLKYYNNGLQKRPYSGLDLKEKTCHEILADAGYKCFLMNIPYSYPPRIAGDILGSWWGSGKENFSHPPTLLKEAPLLKKFVAFPKGGILKSKKKMIRENIEILHNNKKIINNVLARRKHDFLFFMMSTPDLVQHIALKECYNNPNSTISLLARLFFAELDDLTRSVVESMNEEDNLLILSDHGFKIYKGTFYLNDWLHQRGYLQTSLTSNSLDKTITTARHVLDVGYLAPYFNKTKTSARIWKMMVGNLDDFCRRKLDLAISYSVHRKFDLEHSLAYCREESEGGIRLSPRITSNHSARNTLVKKIIKELSYLVGLKAIRREDLDEGPYLGSLADIYIDSEQYFVQGGIHGSILDPTPIAQHHVDGILILHGKCFTKNLTDASITDITPTILYLLGLPIPSDMSGRVLEEAIKDGPSMVYTTPTQSQISGSHTNEDKDKILSRLKALGYV